MLLDFNKIDKTNLINQLLRDQNHVGWRFYVDIVPNYMPPYPRADTEPKCVIEYRMTGRDSLYLRYSNGPAQGYFWDIYGDDFHSPELALVALHHASMPPTFYKDLKYLESIKDGD